MNSVIHKWVKLICILVILSYVSCSKKEHYAFDIRAGEASETLKQFADQARVEILINEKDLKKIITNSVHGTMPSLTALKKMISGTGLVFIHDRETNAIAVYYPDSKI